MTETELAFLCKVFLDDFSNEPGEMAEWFQNAVSQDEQTWLGFLRTCEELSKGGDQ